MILPATLPVSSSAMTFAADRSWQPPYVPREGLLIFLHIPKTAGTTLSRIIRIKLGIWPPQNLWHHSLTFGFYQINPIEARLQYIQSLPAAQQRQIRLFQGHFGFGVHPHLPRPNYYVSMLRDPVERVVSAYYQLRRGRPEDALAKDMSFEEFVNCGKDFGRFLVDNGQVRAIIGTDGNPDRTPFGQMGPQHLARALHNLEHHFAFVGLSERFDESALLLKQILGWKQCKYASANIAPQRKKVAEFPAHVIERVRELNALDQALYDHVAQQFQSMIDQQGDRFPVELAKFRGANERYARTMGPLIDLLPNAKRLGQKLGLVH